MVANTKNAEEVKGVEEVKEVVVKGNVIIAYKGGSKHDKESKFRFALNVTENMQSLRNLYTKICESPLRPKWEKNELETTVNLKSVYEIPVRGVDTFEDINPEAEVTVKIKVKETGIYPMAIIVTKNGKPVDPFEGM